MGEKLHKAGLSWVLLNLQTSFNAAMSFAVHTWSLSTKQLLTRHGPWNITESLIH